MKFHISHFPLLTPIAAAAATVIAAVALVIQWPSTATLAVLQSGAPIAATLSVPMLVSLASMLLLCSMALWALELGHRVVALAIAGTVAVAVTATIASWVINVAPPFGIFLFGLPAPGSMYFPSDAARDAAMPVALASLAIVLLASNVATSVIRPVGWAAGLQLCLAPGVRYLASLLTPIGALPELNDLAPRPQIVLIWIAVTLFGTALMGSRHTSSLADNARRTVDWSARVRATVVVVVVTITLTLWHTLRAAEIHQLQEQAQTATRIAVSEWQKGIADRVRSNDRLGQHWLHLGWNISAPVFLADSQSFMHDYAGVHAVITTDAQGHVMKIARRKITIGATPSITDEAILVDAADPGFPLELTDNGLAMARAAIAERTRLRSKNGISVNGVGLLQTVSPVLNAKQQVVGALMLVFRRDINDALLLEGVATDFYLRVFTNGALTYSHAARGEASDSWPRPFSATETARFGENEYIFEIAPSSKVVAHALTWTPALVLIFAWASLILLSFALYNERRAYALARDRERILNESLDLICTLDANGRYVTVNETSMQVLGYDSKEIIGRHFTDLVHAGDREMLLKQWQDAQAGIRPPALPIRFVHQNGKVIYLQGNAHWSAEEQLFFCDMRDVSDQHSAELAQQHAANTFSTGVEQAGCVVYEFLYDSQQISWVGAIYALTGYEPHELMASSFEDWMNSIHPDDRNHVRNTLERCLESRQPHTIDYRLKRKDGEYVPVLDRGRYIEDEAHRQPRMIGALIDLSAIRQQENALRRSEERYRIIATQVGAVILEREIKTNRARVFGPVEQLFGYTKEQFESRPFGSDDTMLHIEDRARVIATVAEAERNLSSYYSEYRRRHRGGHYIHIAARGVVLPGPDGLAERSIIAITDITERKQADARLQESEERFRSAAEQARQIIYEFVLGEKLEIVELRFAGAAEEVLGYAAAELRELQSTDRFALVHPDDIQTARLAGGESLETSYQFNVEHRLRHKDGHYVHVENRGAVRRDASGNITGIVGTLIDISARKAAEAERQVYVLQIGKLADIARKVSTLLSQHELFDYLVQSMRELVVANAATIVLRDPAFPDAQTTTVSYAEQYGLQRGDATPFGSLELHDLLGGSDKPVRLTVEQTSSDPRWSALTQNDDLHHPLRGWLAAPLIARDGVKLGLLEVTDKIHGDFTESDAQALSQLAGLASVAVENIRLYATLEERVAARTRELQISNRELEAFSYSVSHDLRAPLRAIAGFSSILEQEYGPKLDNAAQRYLQRIGSGVERMANLIDDLLSLARVSRLELKRESVDLTTLCRGIAQRQTERWPERDIKIKIDPRMRVSADPRLVEVALENLIENAIKFTGTRTQTQIHIGKRAVDGNPAFFVQDNGVGFDPQYAANLFGVFQRLHSASEFPGTGVGLATVQRILQRHHGRVWAESQIDQGAAFYFAFDSEA